MKLIVITCSFIIKIVLSVLRVKNNIKAITSRLLNYNFETFSKRTKNKTFYRWIQNCMINNYYWFDTVVLLRPHFVGVHPRHRAMATGQFNTATCICLFATNLLGQSITNHRISPKEFRKLLNIYRPVINWISCDDIKGNELDCNIIHLTRIIKQAYARAIWEFKNSRIVAV